MPPAPIVPPTTPTSSPAPGSPGSGLNPNGTTTAIGTLPTPSSGYTPPSAISASSLGTPATPINVPPPSSQPQTPNLQSLLAQFNTPNAQQSSDQNSLSGIMGNLTDLINKSGTESQAQGDLNASMGVNALGDQLKGINNQILQLNHDALAATVATDGAGNPNFFATGQQAQIAKQKAVQMTGLSAAASVLQGQYSDAQAKVQQALDNEFKPIQSAIQSYQTMLTQARDNLTQDQQDKVDSLNAQLSALDKQTAQQQQDKSTGYALMMSALKNNPGNQAVQMAFNKANQLDVTDPQYLQKVAALVGQYQTDPVATATAIQQLQNARLSGQSTSLDIQAKRNTLAATSANGIDVPTIVSGITNPNQPSSQLGGLTVNGLNQKAQVYLTNGGNIQGLGLSNSGNSGVQRTLIANYAGYLADKMGMSVPDITAAYKANSKAATQVIERVAKIDTTSNTLTSQFPRLAQVAAQVGNMGITESDLTAGRAAFTRKFGSTAAASYYDLIQTIRSDYSSMQSAVAGGRGGAFFAQNAAEAIPVGLSPDQYTAIGQTIEQSASLATQASGQEAQALIGNSSSPTAGANGPVTSIEPTNNATGTVWNSPNGTYVSDGKQWVLKK